MSNTPNLAIIIPCFNEEQVIDTCYNAVSDQLAKLRQSEKIGSSSFILFVDDGSTDGTWNHIAKLSKSDSGVKALRFSKNYGHQNALLAGLLFARSNCDAAISIDADLQHDISYFEQMIQMHVDGAEIVAGIKRERNDSFFKSVTAFFFYGMVRLLGGEVLQNHADYRLMGQRSLNALAGFGEQNIFLRAIIFQLGFPMASFEYDALPRVAGTTKYSLHKMASLGLNGITSFSILPLRVVTIVGFLVACLCGLLSLYVCYQYLFDSTVPGWSSTVIPIYFLGAVQLLSLGVIGEYLGKTYFQVKGRPRYIVDETI